MVFGDESDECAQGVECMERMREDVGWIRLVWMIDRFEVSLNLLFQVSSSLERSGYGNSSAV